MIKILVPTKNEVVGNNIIKSTKTQINQWYKPHIASIFTWLTSIPVYDGGYTWPDNTSGSTIEIYPIVITGKCSSIFFEVSVFNQGSAIGGVVAGGGSEFKFYPLDEGVPQENKLFEIKHGSEVGEYRWSLTLPLSCSWVDPNTNLRVFAQGKRTIKVKTETDVNGKFDVDEQTFYIDLRPPNICLIENQSETVVDKKYTISATIPGLDGGNYILKIRH